MLRDSDDFRAVAEAVLQLVMREEPAEVPAFRYNSGVEWFIVEDATGQHRIRAARVYHIERDAFEYRFDRQPVERQPKPEKGE